MVLHGYFRSSAAYRVRIALAWKGVRTDQVSVHLVRGGGEQHLPAFRALNPQGRVPALVLDDGHVLVQSPAILEWIEETWPTPPLLPADPLARADVRALAAIVGCDVHPLNNLAVLQVLRREFGQDEDGVKRWIGRWIGDGFRALEAMTAGRPGSFLAGPEPTLADVYLVPQIFNARRFGIDLAPYPRLLSADAAARALPAFAEAAPERQPDHE